MAVALENWLETWAGNGSRARHDYDTEEHLISEMLHDDYFGQIHYRLRAGDVLFVCDAARQRATFIIEDIDSSLRKVKFSILRTHYLQPITKPAEREVDPGLTVRWRGPRGGGWCVVDGNDQIVSRDHRTKELAQEALITLSKKTEVA